MLGTHVPGILRDESIIAQGTKGHMAGSSVLFNPVLLEAEDAVDTGVGREPVTEEFGRSVVFKRLHPTGILPSSWTLGETCWRLHLHIRNKFLPPLLGDPRKTLKLSSI